jgi:hypothetical protein
MQDFSQKKDDSIVDKEHNCSKEAGHINIHKKQETMKKSPENDNSLHQSSENNKVHK